MTKRSAKKNGGKRFNKRKPGMRAKAARVLANAVGAAPRRPFGGNGTAQQARALIRSLNARLPRSPGLPRPVGPYTTVTTTTLHTTSAGLFIVCPVLKRTGAGDHWLASCGVESVVMGDSVNKSNNSRTIGIPSPVMTESAGEAVPCAVSIQVMNGNALQTTTGVIAIGRVNQQLHMSEETASWTEFGNRFISYYSPRLCAAPKLALRGVRCSAFPLDMDEYSQFERIKPNHGLMGMAETFHFGAFSPIIIYQTQAVPIELSVMVHIQWRARFDPLNPATASHSFHPHTPDGVWATAIKSCSEAGHGVEDITESIANAGMAVGKAALAADRWDTEHSF